MTADVRTTSATIHRAVYRTLRTVGDTSVNPSLSQPAAWTTTAKRREQNRMYAAVNLKRNLRSTYCTIEAADGQHEASRGLSAIAGLLVLPAPGYCFWTRGPDTWVCLSWFCRPPKWPDLLQVRGRVCCASYCRFSLDSYFQHRRYVKILFYVTYVCTFHT